MPKTLTVANWKMYGNRKLWRELTQKSSAAASNLQTKMILATPAAAYADVREHLSEYSKVALAAQDIHPNDEGAFTGDNSVCMLKEFGGKFTLVGHSERRLAYKERGVLLNDKIKQAIKHEVVPIYCIGESLAERNADKTISILDEQLQEGLNGIHIEQAEQLVVAYEPVWAISSSAGSLGREPEGAELDVVFSFLRKMMTERFGNDIGNAIKLLYGGSVKPENAEGIMARENISGVLIGGASLKAESFLKIAQIVSASEND